MAKSATADRERCELASVSCAPGAARPWPSGPRSVPVQVDRAVGTRCVLPEHGQPLVDRGRLRRGASPGRDPGVSGPHPRPRRAPRRGPRRARLRDTTVGTVGPDGGTQPDRELSRCRTSDASAVLPAAFDVSATRWVFGRVRGHRRADDGFPARRRGRCPGPRADQRPGTSGGRAPARRGRHPRSSAVAVLAEQTSVVVGVRGAELSGHRRGVGVVVREDPAQEAAHGLGVVARGGVVQAAELVVQHRRRAGRWSSGRSAGGRWAAGPRARRTAPRSASRPAAAR